MKHTLTHHEIVNALLDDDNAHWSRKAAHALADWYEELDEETGQDTELDVVAIRCDWSEDTAEELIDNYKQNPNDTLEDVIAYVEDNTELIILDNEPVTYLYINF